MIIPETPIEELNSKASLSDVIAKVNEIVRAINQMWNPEDGAP